MSNSAAGYLKPQAATPTLTLPMLEGDEINVKTGKTCHTHTKDASAKITTVNGDNYTVTVDGSTTATNACKSCITIADKKKKS